MLNCLGELQLICRHVIPLYYLHNTLHFSTTTCSYIHCVQADSTVYVRLRGYLVSRMMAVEVHNI